MPDHEPRIVPEAAYDPTQFSQCAALVERNPCGLPVPQAATPKPNRGENRTLRQDWKLTGVTQGPSGSAAWLRSTRGGVMRRLAVGDRVRDRGLLEGEADRAVFEIRGERQVLMLGQTLSDRSDPGK